MKKPQPSECSGKDLDLYQTEICSFVCFEIETFRTVFTGLFTESLFLLKLRFGIKKRIKFNSYCFNRFYFMFNVVLTSGFDIPVTVTIVSELGLSFLVNSRNPCR